MLRKGLEAFVKADQSCYQSSDKVSVLCQANGKRVTNPAVDEHSLECRQELFVGGWGFFFSCTELRSLFVWWGESGESQQKSCIPQKFKAGFPWCLTNEVVSFSEVFWQAFDSLSNCFFFFFCETNSKSICFQLCGAGYERVLLSAWQLSPCLVSEWTCWHLKNVWKLFMTLSDVLGCLKTQPLPVPPTPLVNNLFTSQADNFLLHSAWKMFTIQFSVQKLYNLTELLATS